MSKSKKNIKTTATKWGDRSTAAKARMSETVTAIRTKDATVSLAEARKRAAVIEDKHQAEVKANRLETLAKARKASAKVRTAKAKKSTTKVQKKAVTKWADKSEAEKKRIIAKRKETRAKNAKAKKAGATTTSQQTPAKKRTKGVATDVSIVIRGKDTNGAWKIGPYCLASKLWELDLEINLDTTPQFTLTNGDVYYMILLACGNMRDKGGRRGAMTKQISSSAKSHTLTLLVNEGRLPHAERQRLGRTRSPFVKVITRKVALARINAAIKVIRADQVAQEATKLALTDSAAGQTIRSVANGALAPAGPAIVKSFDNTVARMRNDIASVPLDELARLMAQCDEARALMADALDSRSEQLREQPTS